jgi:hypothetical protein
MSEEANNDHDCRGHQRSKLYARCSVISMVDFDQGEVESSIGRLKFNGLTLRPPFLHLCDENFLL